MAYGTSSVPPGGATAWDKLARMKMECSETLNTLWHNMEAPRILNHRLKGLYVV